MGKSDVTNLVAHVNFMKFNKDKCPELGKSQAQIKVGWRMA